MLDRFLKLSELYFESRVLVVEGSEAIVPLLAVVLIQIGRGVVERILGPLVPVGLREGFPGIGFFDRLVLLVSDWPCS